MLHTDIRTMESNKPKLQVMVSATSDHCAFQPPRLPTKMSPQNLDLNE